jgi:hypothetical protein
VSGYNKAAARPHGIYRVNIHHDDPYVRAESITRKPYDGMVYCVTVPNGLIVTRRHGRVSIHGNSAKEMGLVPVKRLTRRQKDIRFLITDLLRFQLHQKMRVGALPETVVVGKVEADGSSTGIERPTDEAFTVVLPELSMRDQAQITAAVNALTASLSQITMQGWLRPETAAKIIAASLSQLGREIKADEEFTPGMGPALGATQDYSQQNLARALAQLERVGRGDGENIGQPKDPQPAGRNGVPA